MTRLLPLIALAFVVGCTSVATNGSRFTEPVKPGSPQATGSTKRVSSAAGYCNRIAEPSQRGLCLSYYSQF